MELHAAVELHADPSGPGRLSGVLMVYGEPVADGRGHVFLPGSLSWEDDGILLNLSHDRKQPLMRVQPETDGERVLLAAVLPDTTRGRDAAVMVRNGTYRGLSAEVQVSRDRMVQGRREIEAAALVGAALVDTPAIRSAQVTVHERQRARRRIWL
ncbi:MAG: HK97 family phage prohead protease [Acidobacteria bacterium]|nr:HK97 family phage prohead protease [Acidobacteriota bacterium]